MFAAAMTADRQEAAEHRAEVKAECWSEDEAPATCSVIFLATRRAAQ